MTEVLKKVRIGLDELYELLQSRYPAYDEQVVNKVLQLIKDAAKDEEISLSTCDDFPECGHRLRHLDYCQRD